MLSKHIVNAQKVLRELDKTPIIVKPDNSVQVTYSGDTYRMLMGVLVACSEEGMSESSQSYIEAGQRPSQPVIRREKV